MLIYPEKKVSRKTSNYTILQDKKHIKPGVLKPTEFMMNQVKSHSNSSHESCLFTQTTLKELNSFCDDYG